MPIPMNDASQALKTNPEKTEEALQKVLPIPTITEIKPIKNVLFFFFFLVTVILCMTE